MNLRSKVAQQLNCKEEDLIWSDVCGNPETMYRNEELGTNSFRELGYWVKR